jgi:hypothetical protein
MKRIIFCLILFIIFLTSITCCNRTEINNNELNKIVTYLYDNLNIHDTTSIKNFNDSRKIIGKNSIPILFYKISQDTDSLKLFIIGEIIAKYYKDDILLKLGYFYSNNHTKNTNWFCIKLIYTIILNQMYDDENINYMELFHLTNDEIQILIDGTQYYYPNNLEHYIKIKEMKSIQKASESLLLNSFDESIKLKIFNTKGFDYYLIPDSSRAILWKKWWSVDKNNIYWDNKKYKFRIK